MRLVKGQPVNAIFPESLYLHASDSGFIHLYIIFHFPYLCICLYILLDLTALFLGPQEAKMSQEQLADQVVKTSEEKHKLSVELEASNKVLGPGGEVTHTHTHTHTYTHARTHACTIS